jgi:ribose-phosphate pyrophosphokinase
MIIVPGSASVQLAKKLAATLDVELAEVESRKFPDDERYVCIHSKLDNKEVIVVQTTYPDDKIVELLLLLDAVHSANPSRCIVVIPYFGYARQDKVFKAGEPISARAIAQLINRYATEMYTIDIHATNVLKWFDIPAKNLTGMTAIAEYFRGHPEQVEKVDFVLSPDKGAIELATSVSQILNCESDYLEKTRLAGDKVEIKPKSIDVVDKSVLIVDDIISTGGTIIEATKCLRAQGVRRVYAACTHGVFARNALDKLITVCDKVVATDTIENKVSEISVAQTLAEAILTDAQ